MASVPSLHFVPWSIASQGGKKVALAAKNITFPYLLPSAKDTGASLSENTQRAKVFWVHFHKLPAFMLVM